jgi:hypothetical protein
MSKSIIPELRPYLECVLDEKLARAGMSVRDAQRRERMLNHLQDQFERLLLYRLMLALPAIPRQQFASLIEHDASDEDLKAFTRSHLSDIPDFVDQVLQEFRQQRMNLTQ